MAWSDLGVLPSEVMGHAENLLTDRQSGRFDAGPITSEREEVARSHLETALFRDGDLDQYIDDAGGPDVLLDELEADADLKGRLETGIALSFLAKFADDDAVISGGRTTERKQGFQRELERWAESFSSIAAFELGYSDSATAGGTDGGAFANTMDRHSTKS